MLGIVGVDARAAFLDPHRGLGRVAHSITEALLRLLPGQVVVFVPHGVAVPPAWYPLAARIVQLRRPRRGALLFDAPAWRWTLARHPVEVLHLPAWGVPRGVSVPVVATFHDATPFRFPSPPSLWRRLRARMAVRSLARATAIHAVSRHAANELRDVVPNAPTPASVVHLGVAPVFRPAALRRGTNLLFVGGADPHKNLALVLRVLTLPGAEQFPPLAIAGPAATDVSLKVAVTRAGLTARVTFASPRSDEGLATLYQDAVAMLLPSLNEGFGLPALEAMACGCPVLASDAGALPEVCGDAAVLLDPADAEAWRDAIARVVGDAAFRDRLAAAGIERASRFTWDATARGLVELYGEVVRARSSRI